MLVSEDTVTARAPFSRPEGPATLVNAVEMVVGAFVTVTELPRTDTPVRTDDAVGA